VNHDLPCYSVNWVSTDPSVSLGSIENMDQDQKSEGTSGHSRH
jgi:hypothetical protein